MTAPDAQPNRSPTVGYAPALPAWRRRSTKRRVATTIGLLVAAILAWSFGPSVWHRLALLDAQRRCLNASAPPDWVVYDDAADHAAALTASDPQYLSLGSSRPTVWFSGDWARFYSLLSPPGRQPSATLFIGERRTPAGARRLLVIDGVRNDDYVDSVTPAVVHLQSTVVEVGSIASPPRLLKTTASWIGWDYPVPFNPDFPVRFFAGQPDPADPSHATIAYEADGTQHVIDAWLRDDDTVTLERRASPATSVVTPPLPPSAASPRSPG
jgi:hypothetical protein